MQSHAQTTDTVLMVRPLTFGYNAETATNNSFQTKEGSEKTQVVQADAVLEFDALVEKLNHAGIQVVVADDYANVPRPDAVFPNNWVTFHPGLVITYPMFAPNRRRERRSRVIAAVEIQAGIPIAHRKNLEFNERFGNFLEGTGSMVFDHTNRIIYASLSPRTHENLLDEVCEALEYSKVVFRARDSKGVELYHTNVMMAIGDKFVVVCLDSVTDKEENKMLRESLKKSGREIVEISMEQMGKFAGNMLQLRNNQDQAILVMSDQAFGTLSTEQVKTLEKYATIVHSSLKTIEKYGGGSARCMMAEVFHE